MAITYVGQNNNAVGSPSTALTVSMPAGMAAGDVAYAMVSHVAIGGVTVDISGWTQVATYDLGSAALDVFRKVQSSTLDTNYTVNLSGAAIVSSIVQAFRGVNTSSPEDATATVANSGSSPNTSPDCPAIVTTTNGAWVLATIAHNVNAAPSAYPTGYTNTMSRSGTDGAGTNASCAMASKAVATAGTENPSAASLPSAGNWVAGTVAIRPATGATAARSRGYIF